MKKTEVNKRYLLGVVQNGKGGLNFVVKDNVTGVCEIAEPTPNAAKVLNNFKAKTAKITSQKVVANVRRTNINTLSGYRCACCGSDVSMHTLDFLKRNMDKVPVNHHFFKKVLCPNCQKLTGVSAYLLSKRKGGK